MAIKNREIANDWNMVRIVIPLLLTPTLWPFDNNVSTSELMKQRNLFHEKLFKKSSLLISASRNFNFCHFTNFMFEFRHETTFWNLRKSLH